jgi:hypothetical protein
MRTRRVGLAIMMVSLMCVDGLDGHIVSGRHDPRYRFATDRTKTGPECTFVG